MDEIIPRPAQECPGTRTDIACVVRGVDCIAIWQARDCCQHDRACLPRTHHTCRGKPSYDFSAGFKDGRACQAGGLCYQPSCVLGRQPARAGGYSERLSGACLGSGRGSITPFAAMSFSAVKTSDMEISLNGKSPYRWYLFKNKSLLSSLDSSRKPLA